MYQQKKSIMTFEENCSELRKTVNQLKATVIEKEEEIEKLKLEHSEEL